MVGKLLMFVAIPLGVLVGVGLLLPVHRRSGYFRWGGVLVMALSGLVGALFIAGETAADPGGWAAVGLVAPWLVPLLALAALAWLRPAWGAAALSVLTATVLALNLWFLLAPESWRSLEDNHGPVRAIAAFAVAVPVGVLGWRRPAVAGWLLIALGVVPLVLAYFRSGGRGLMTSWTIVGVPGLIAGTLYLLSAYLPARSTAARPAVLGASAPD